MPTEPINSGSINTKEICNTNVLKNDIKADIIPLFNAVKKDDINIHNPENRKEIEYMRIPIVDRWMSPSSPLANILANGSARDSPNMNIMTAKEIIIIVDFFKTFFSSSVFFAPKWYPTTGATPIEYPMNIAKKTNETYMIMP